MASFPSLMTLSLKPRSPPSDLSALVFALSHSRLLTAGSWLLISLVFLLLPSSLDPLSVMSTPGSRLLHAFLLAALLWTSSFGCPLSVFFLPSTSSSSKFSGTSLPDSFLLLWQFRTFSSPAHHLLIPSFSFLPFDFNIFLLPFFCLRHFPPLTIPTHPSLIPSSSTLPALFNIVLLQLLGLSHPDFSILSSTFSSLNYSDSALDSDTQQPPPTLLPSTSKRRQI